MNPNIYKTEYSFIIGVPESSTFCNVLTLTLVKTWCNISDVAIYFQIDRYTSDIVKIFRISKDRCTIPLNDILGPHLSEADKLLIILKYS